MHPTDVSSFLRNSGVALACAVGTLVVIACGSGSKGGEKTEAAPGALAGGVREACDARKGWNHLSSRECTACRAKAATPKCTTCNVKPYSGACADQDKARRDEAACKSTTGCVMLCNNDCECIDKCYAKDPACQKLGAALESCLNTACEASCK